MICESESTSIRENFHDGWIMPWAVRERRAFDYDYERRTAPWPIKQFADHTAGAYRSTSCHNLSLWPIMMDRIQTHFGVYASFGRR